MRRRNRYGRAIGLCVCLLSVTTSTASQQPSAGQGEFVHSEVTLDARTLSVRFAPTLRAENPAHRAVLTPVGGATDGRMLVARLESDATLRIDTIEIVADQSEARRDLWLRVTSDGWQLEVTDPEERGAGVAETVRLSHATSAAVAPTFSAALIATGDSTCRLVMRWGEHEWTTELQGTDRPRDQTERRSPVPGSDAGRDFDANAVTRAQRFSTRNETALVLPDGQRLSVLFPRALTVGGRDFPHIGAATNGSIIQWTAGAVTRLKTDVPLRFGGVTLDTGNLAADFAGAYGLWLKRTERGWRLVFNNEPDAWGTQYDPAFDTAEIDLHHSQGGAVSRPFAVALVPTGADRGRLAMHWGAHDWFADFVVGGY